MSSKSTIKRRKSDKFTCNARVSGLLYNKLSIYLNNDDAHAVRTVIKKHEGLSPLIGNVLRVNINKDRANFFIKGLHMGAKKSFVFSIEPYEFENKGKVIKGSYARLHGVCPQVMIGVESDYSSSSDDESEDEPEEAEVIVTRKVDKEN